MKSMKNTLMLAMVAAGCAAAGTAQAGVVDIQFLLTGGSPATSFSGSQGAYTGDGLTSPTWNAIPATSDATTGSASNLTASDGIATTEGVTFTKTTGYVSSSSYTNALFQSYLISNPAGSGPGTGTVTLSGLADGGSYQLYLYSGDGAYNNAITDFAVTTGTGSPAAGSNAGVVNVNNGNLGFTENTNYVVFNAIASTTGNLAISYTGGTPSHGEADISGLQVISGAAAVPAPATLALFSAGALGLLLVGRKRKSA